jgi:hypothetical protein
MSIVNFTGRVCAVLIVAGSMGTALAEESLGVTAAEDGAVEAERQCDVYVAGVATSRRADPLRYRWLDGASEVSPWQAVRADGTAPLELCGLPAGSHRLTLEVTDGRGTASDTMTATIVGAPALIAQGAAP